MTLLEYLDISWKLSLSTIVPDYIKTNGIIVDMEIARGMSPKKLHEVYNTYRLPINVRKVSG